MKPNEYIYDYLCSKIYSIDAVSGGDLCAPRTELDTHANMIVLGRHCFIFDTVEGRHCDVQPFDKALGSMRGVPVVDAAIAYDCPYTHRTYLLLVRNALYIPSMENNLIPPFILREAGIEVQDVPKIHVDNPSASDHCIKFDDFDLKIPLQLWGIFSFFHTRKPTEDEISTCDKIFLTPDSENWDPYSDHFAQNEESMIDWEGNMNLRGSRKEHKLDLYPEPVSNHDYDAAVEAVIATSLANLSLTSVKEKEIMSGAMLDSLSMSNQINSAGADGKFGMSIGATNAVPNDSFFCQDPETYMFDFDNPSFEIHTAIGSKPKTVSAEFLSKIWNIKNDEASKCLKQNTQLCRGGADNDLSRHFSTNDRMLRYKRINSQFFTDTFFVGGDATSTRGNKCAQIFVSDKGYVKVYPMKSKGDFINALRMFCKEIGVPLSLVVDPSGEQTSKEVKHFCNQVGTTLRILEDATQWADQAELYVGQFKESTCKDLRQTDSPLVLWDYCIQRRERIHNVTPKNLFQLNGNTPTVATLGVEEDISNICQFGWYDWCYYGK